MRRGVHGTTATNPKISAIIVGGERPSVAERNRVVHVLPLGSCVIKHVHNRTLRAARLHCSYGDKTKQARGPAYVAQLEDKIKELEMKLSSSRRSSLNLQDQTCDLSPVACLAINGNSPCTKQDYRTMTPTNNTGPSPQCLVDALAGPSVDNNSMSESAITMESLRDSAVLTMTENVKSPVASSASETSLAQFSLPDLIAPYSEFAYRDTQSWLESVGESWCALDGNSWSGESNLTSPYTCEQDIDSGFSSSYSHNIDITEQRIGDGLGTKHEGMLLHCADANVLEMESTGNADLLLSKALPVVDIVEQKSPGDCSSRSNSMANGFAGRIGPSLRERNRVAAAKCRSKRKVMVDHLKADAARLEKDNTSLKELSRKLRTQQSHLRELALQHSVHDDCCTQIHQYNAERLAQTISVDVKSRSP